MSLTRPEDQFFTNKAPRSGSGTLATTGLGAGLPATGMLVVLLTLALARRRRTA